MAKNKATQPAEVETHDLHGDSAHEFIDESFESMEPEIRDAKPGHALPPQPLSQTPSVPIETNVDEFLMMGSVDETMLGVTSKEFLAAKLLPAEKDPEIKLDTRTKLPAAFNATGFENNDQLAIKCKMVLGEALFKEIDVRARGSGILVHRYLQQSMWHVITTGGFSVLDAVGKSERSSAVDENADHAHVSTVKEVLNPEVFGRLLDHCREAGVGNVTGLRAGIQRCLDNGNFAR